MPTRNVSRYSGFDFHAAQRFERRLGFPEIEPDTSSDCHIESSAALDFQLRRFECDIEHRRTTQVRGHDESALQRQASGGAGAEDVARRIQRTDPDKAESGRYPAQLLGARQPDAAERRVKLLGKSTVAAKASLELAHPAPCLHLIGVQDMLRVDVH